MLRWVLLCAKTHKSADALPEEIQEMGRLAKQPATRISAAAETSVGLGLSPGRVPLRSAPAGFVLPRCPKPPKGLPARSAGYRNQPGARIEALSLKSSVG